jgi:Domain of unknown function (DUF4129)
MYKLLLFCCLLLAAPAKPVTKVSKKKPPPVKVYHTMYDSSKVNVHHYNTAAMDKYRDSTQFNYEEKATVKAGLSVWQRFWVWVWKMLEKLFGGSRSPSQPSQAPSFAFMKYVMLAIALGLLVLVIIKMAGMNIANIFNRTPKNINIPYSESLENIHHITFEEEIEKALGQRNYRLAIRLLYLSTLKQLNDANFIHWQADKTNSAYINELADAEKRQSFSILTRQFEYVWYGDFPVDGPSFQNINTLFHDFKMMLK